MVAVSELSSHSRATVTEMMRTVNESKYLLANEVDEEAKEEKRVKGLEARARKKANSAAAAAAAAADGPGPQSH